VLGLAQTKMLGPMSFWIALQVLGLRVHLVEEMDAIRQMEGRWERGDMSRATMLGRLSMKAIVTFLPELAREMSAPGAAKSGDTCPG
jgi:hypothetical protein